MLRLNCIVRREFQSKSYFDNRVKVNRVVAKYLDEHGEPYRKSFETKGKWPEVPDSGSHEQLNEIKKQWLAN